LKTGINGGDIDFIGPLINKKQQEHSLAMLEKQKVKELQFILVEKLGERIFCSSGID